MPNDFKNKMPSKSERIIGEMAMQLHEIDHRMWSISSHLLATGMLLNIDPKKIAEILTSDDAQLREYAGKINDEIKKIEATKKPADEHAGHDHAGHDHPTEAAPEQPQA